jgi:hypothetical protein
VQSRRLYSAGEVMNNKSEQLKLRIDSWVAEGRKLMIEIIEADDDSMQMDDMQDVIINGLGVPDEYS